MLSGFCGTLMTPMAANFNIVPAALLELPDRYGVIRVQLPTGALMLVVQHAADVFLCLSLGERLLHVCPLHGRACTGVTL